MLSIGIGFGQGFDNMNAVKVIQSLPPDSQYDLLVVGTNLGGIACAREARLAGKKTAMIRWKELTPAEAEGFDEDLNEMAKALEMNESSVLFAESVSERKSVASNLSRKTEIGDSANTRKYSKSSAKSSRKVRQSRLDLNNELFKRGKECVKVMQNVAALGDIVENAFNSGWRLCTTRPPLSMNWTKMTEEIMDYIMKKNHDLINELSEAGVEIIEGRVEFKDNHTVIVSKGGEEHIKIRADLICIAPTGHYEFPKDVEGSDSFGISFDDFPRMNEQPGRTLVVGGTIEGLECAGILACCRFPVTLISRKKILDGCDSEISEMIILNLRKKGVMFLENCTLKSIVMNRDKQILATFAVPVSEEEENEEKENKEDEILKTAKFDTVLFAVGKNVNLENLRLDYTGVELEVESEKIRTNHLEQTSASNIYALGNAVAFKPDNPEMIELAGKLLGRRLFHGENQEMDYSFNPVVIYTPIEYAFVGISEDSAFYRFGLYCVEVHYGFFQPLDFVLPPANEKCFAKVIVFKSTNQVIGMHILGPRAGEIIQGFATALRNGLTMKNLQTMVGVPATSAQEFLKLRKHRFHEEKILTDEEIISGVSKRTIPTDGLGFCPPMKASDESFVSTSLI